MESLEEIRIRTSQEDSFKRADGNGASITPPDEMVNREVDAEASKAAGDKKDIAPTEQNPKSKGSPTNTKGSAQDNMETPPLMPTPTRAELPASPDTAATQADIDEEDAIAKSFQRSASPTSAMQRTRGAIYEKVGEEGVSRMHKFSLYETTSYFYLVGGDLLEQKYRILKIDRTVEPGELNIIEDDIVYTKQEMKQILNAVDDGHKSSGGLKQRSATWGLLGFIRFTGAYYALFITKRTQVAVIGGHYVYQIDGTELIQVTSPRTKTEKHPEEARFLGILGNLDLTKSFYFSYSYDITRSLQHNILRERRAIDEDLPYPLAPDHNEMFVWNSYLLKPALERMRNVYDWCLPIIHGYVDQSLLSVYWAKVVYITVIARRSRFFAGARFLKRGANDLGYVANDVETEQIVADMTTTSFHGPGQRLYANPNITSFLQHRGSIPLFWSQDAAGMTPKPDIEIDLVDPFYSAAALHFDNLFKRYGAPVYVLNLVKSRERTPRESKLLKEFTTAITYLNQFLPEDKKILYKAWDMSRASKARDQDVIGTLESIGEETIPITGFFKNGMDAESGLRLQNGVVRTNCIDCLDRTNAAQFVIGKRALGHQLYALGIIDYPNVEYDSDVVDLFTHMFHDHGDTIAVQYGSSALVNSVQTYRKINAWKSNSRDMVESFKRYYNNSFLDAQRQEAYNLFLGNYVFAHGEPMLWDLATDYYLHHTDPRLWLERHRPAYINWFTPEYLKEIELPPSTASILPSQKQKGLTFFDDYWLEYYKPLALSSFQKVFSYKIQSNLRFIPYKNNQEGKYDLSPFVPRVTHEHPHVDTTGSGQAKSSRRKGVKIVDPTESESKSETGAEQPAPNDSVPPKLKPSSLGAWVELQTHTPHYGMQSIMKEPAFELKSTLPLLQVTSNAALPTSKAHQQLEAFTRLVHKSLNPTVDDEIDEYEDYVSHPLTLPLVVRSDQDFDRLAESGSQNVINYVEYVNKAHKISATDQNNTHNQYSQDSHHHDPTAPLSSINLDGGGGITTNTVHPSSSSYYYNNTTNTYTHHPHPSTNRHHHNRHHNNNTASTTTWPRAWRSIDEIADQSLEEYHEFLEIPQEGLSVLEEDADLKRYRRYKSWLRGKSLFKQRERDLGGGVV